MRPWKTLRCVVLSHKWVPRHNDEEPYLECRRCGKRDLVNYHPGADLESPNKMMARAYESVTKRGDK
jgi:hypothetical protein